MRSESTMGPSLVEGPIALSSSVNASVVVDGYAAKVMGDQDLGELVASINAGLDAVWAGDLRQAEAMMYGQACALQSIFASLARQALQYKSARDAEVCLRQALKAQSQCRATLEALAAIKNPPLVIARQANINQGGQQQINNGPAIQPPEPRPYPLESAQNELLEANHGKRVDGATSCSSVSTHQALGAVGAVLGPEDYGGQGPVLQKRVPRWPPACSEGVGVCSGSGPGSPKGLAEFDALTE